MRFYLAILTAFLVAAGGLVGAPPSHAQAKADIVIGMQCDRTGATQIVGTVLCPGFHDYIALINSKGGVEGHKIKALEIDHEYKVPPGVESYERHKKEGAVTIAIYGTRSEEHTSELQSQSNLVCRLLLEKKKNINIGVTKETKQQHLQSR